MHRRILFGVAAWLLGAATATAGSLLAVSLLGQGITGGSGPLLSQVAVDRALASESAERSAKPTSDAGDTGAAGTATASPGVTRTAGSGTAASGTATPSPSASSPAASASDTPASTPAASATAVGTPAGGGTVLASADGDVVAECQAGGAYLESWSPAQGFVVDDVYRGPAQTARVTFTPATGSDDSAVTMLVSCSAGTPSAKVQANEAGH
jgi:hypothetical protein